MDVGEFVGFSMMACVTSVVVIAMILGVGALLARKKMLADKSLAQFSKLVAFVFLPCLLFDKVTSAVSGTESLLDLLSLTLFAIAHHIVAHFVSWIIFHFSFFSGKQKSPLTRRLLINATSFQNVLYIPLTFLSTLCDQPDLWGNSTALAKSKAVGYIGMYVVIWQIILWTLGFSLFRSAARKEEQIKNLIEQDKKNIEEGKKVEEEVEENVKQNSIEMNEKTTTTATIVEVDQKKDDSATISEIKANNNEELVSSETKQEQLELKNSKNQKVENKEIGESTKQEIKKDDEESSETKNEQNETINATNNKLTLRKHDQEHGHNKIESNTQQVEGEQTHHHKHHHKPNIVVVPKTESTFKFVLKSLVKNPPVISVLLAIIFCLIPGAKTNLYIDPPVPLLAIPRNFIQIVGGAATPLALISIGSKLSTRPRLQDVPIAGLFASIFIRLLLVPGIFLPITIAIFQANVVSQQTVIFFMVVMIRKCEWN